MKKNRTTRIVGTNVILVPYQEKHVKKYHEWMKSIELQHFTASKPLTLAQEYQMQKEWLEDEKKCTFIVLDRDILLSTGNEIDAMIGDTNLFFNDLDNPNTTEAEIMIAETKQRGKRRGWEAMLLMFCYGIDVLNVDRYRVKITQDNEKSINMFKKLNFYEIERSNIFQEVTYEKRVDQDWINWLHSETSASIRDEYYSTK